VLDVRGENLCEKAMRFPATDPKIPDGQLDRNQVSQRLKADIQLLWLIHTQFQETERIPEGYFLLHLPQCLMQSKSLPDATGTLIQTSRRREILGWLGIRWNENLIDKFHFRLLDVQSVCSLMPRAVDRFCF
jgi:hypothetical protein